MLIVKTTNTPDEAMQELARCLNAQGIKFQPGSKDSALKCKYDAASGSFLHSPPIEIGSPRQVSGNDDLLLEKDKPSKSCKFRIEIVPQEADTEVVFMHQQGSASAYKAIFEIMKNELNLKDKTVVIPQVSVDKEKQ